MPESHEDACADCGTDADYVDPDSGLCDLCAAVQRAMEDTVALDEFRAAMEHAN